MAAALPPVHHRHAIPPVVVFRLLARVFFPFIYPLLLSQTLKQKSFVFMDCALTASVQSSNGEEEEEMSCSNGASSIITQNRSPNLHLHRVERTYPRPASATRKRARASRRAPTTVLTTDVRNFRQMVQEFTGIPATSFSGLPYAYRLNQIAAAGFRPTNNLSLAFSSSPQPPILIDSVVPTAAIGNSTDFGGLVTHPQAPVADLQLPAMSFGSTLAQNLYFPRGYNYNYNYNLNTSDGL